MNNKGTLKIVSIIVGIAVFILLVVLTFNMVGSQAADSEPRDVVVSNIEKNSTKLSWATGTDTQGVIEYGTSPTSLNFFAPEASKEKNHTLDLTLLSPSTTYYFDVRTGDKKYDNGGVPCTFTTKSIENSVAPTETPVPTQSSDTTTQVTPVQHLKIDDNTSCTETDCEVIKTKLGKGCSTQDYFLCLKKITPTQTLTSTPTP